MKKYKVHSLEEIDSLSEEKYKELHKKALSIAEELGIFEVDDKDLEELEASIKLRQTPTSKLGFTMSWDTKEEKKPITSLWNKLRRFKREVVSTLSYYADGYVKFRRALKVYDTYNYPMFIEGIRNEYYSEPKLVCYLDSNKDTDSPCVEDRIGAYAIEASDLSLNSLIHMVNEIEDGNATIYTEKEFVEFINR